MPEENTLRNQLAALLGELSTKSQFLHLPKSDPNLLDSLREPALFNRALDPKSEAEETTTTPLVGAMRFPPKDPTIPELGGGIPNAQPMPPELPQNWFAGIRGSGDLGTLQEFTKNCDHCGLCTTRTKLVFGQGYAQAKVVFVGEGPGKNEDEQGLPFVGRAGKLLTALIFGLGLPRQAVYITNVVKCRPPENREPSPEEALACQPILFQQIKLIKPKLIVALGATALKNLVPEALNISRARGQIYSFAGTQLIPTFHPAYLIRNRTKLNEAYKDFRFILETLEH